MKPKATMIGMSTVLALIFSHCARRSDFPVLKGPYLGQTLPGMTPELFAPGVVSTNMYERDVVVSPDGKEIYFGVSYGGWTTIAVTRLVNGRWTQPEIASYAADPHYFYFEPAMTPDGQRMYFLCTIPRAGQEPAPGWTHQNIWAADRKPDGSWTAPFDPGAPINSDAHHSYFPSVARNRNLYFTRSDKGTTQASIYRCEWVDGRYADPERVSLSTDDRVFFNACISPDEDFLIVCTPKKDNPELMGYYVFFRREDGGWREGICLDDVLDMKETRALSPSISSDGQVFFFATSRRRIDRMREHPISYEALKKYAAGPENGMADIYWVSADVIRNLKP